MTPARVAAGSGAHQDPKSLTMARRRGAMRCAVHSASRAAHTASIASLLPVPARGGRRARHAGRVVNCRAGLGRPP